MKLAIKSLVLSSAAFVATAAFAASQARVDVPFNFTAKGQSFPAGSYAVLMDGGHSFVTLASKASPAKQMTWSVGPAEAATTPVKLSFDVIGENHVLNTIQYGQRITPKLDKAKHGISATTSIGGQ